MPSKSLLAQWLCHLTVPLSHQPAKGDVLLYETLQTPSGSVVKSTSVITAGENG